MCRSRERCTPFWKRLHKSCSLYRTRERAEQNSEWPFVAARSSPGRPLGRGEGNDSGNSLKRAVVKRGRSKTQLLSERASYPAELVE